MSTPNTLSPELKAQIEKEADDLAVKAANANYQPRTTLHGCYSSGYGDGYLDAAKKYALKLQQAEKMMENMAKEIKEACDYAVDGRITKGYSERLKKFLAEYNYKQTKDGTANG